MTRNSSSFARRAVRALVMVGALAALGACADATTQPTPEKSIHAAARRGDDLPPDTPCRSGWLQVDGHWVCADG